MILTIYILIYSFVSAWFNANIINKENWHFSQATLRILTFVGIVYLSTYNIIDVFYLLTVYWIAFDFLLNVLRKLPLFYIGKTSFIDKTLGKYIYIIKLITLIIVLYVKIS